VLSLVRTAIVTLTFGCGVVLLVLLVAARLGTWRNPWLLEVLDMFALFACAPFLAVGLAAVVFRSRALGILTGLAVLFAAQQFGGQLLGLVSADDAVASPAETSPSHLRVMTYSLHSPNEDASGMIDFIQLVQPDVVVFQEATNDYVRLLAPAVELDLPFYVTAGADTDHNGTAIWSRYPLFDAQPIQISPRGNQMIQTRLSTGKQTVRVYAIHLANPTGSARDENAVAAMVRYDPTIRDAELDWLVEATRKLSEPFVVAGDFNTAAGSRPYRGFPATWHDAFGEVGRGFGNTFPSPQHELTRGTHVPLPAPVLRIDYILSSDAIRPIRAWTAEIRLSDHHAVLADLDLA
jgi:endonuclease/exonuclease/phosphatase family metal-dependent hydrolase